MWNPAIDSYLSHRYTARDPDGKRACKAVGTPPPGNIWSCTSNYCPIMKPTTRRLCDVAPEQRAA
jgi:hypothetical protein